jgi:G:T-mismatch repair DNA endonuclease (very short patch repair protein)
MVGIQPFARSHFRKRSETEEMDAREREIGRIAGEQDNVITLAQLDDVGLGRGAVAWRLRVGRYQRLHQKVLLVGPAPPSFAARARAAALAVGDHAAVSQAASQALFGLGPEFVGPIDVTVSGRKPQPRPGITIHQSQLVASEVTAIRGIPVTTVARMICDRSAALNIGELEQLLIEARVQRLVRDADLWAVLGRADGRPGSPQLRELLTEEVEEGYSRSAAERRLRRLVQTAGLPVPVYNAPCCGFHPDALWERERLIVEVDGRRYHGHPSAQERDHRRDQIFAAAGYRVVRVTWRQLVNEPIGVAVRIGQALIWGRSLRSADKPPRAEGVSLRIWWRCGGCFRPFAGARMRAMNIKGSASALAAVALAVGVCAPAAGAATAKNCGSVSYTYPHTNGEGHAALNNLKATGVSCSVARAVAKSDLVHRKAPAGWKAKTADNGGQVILTDGSKKITGEVAN